MAAQCPTCGQQVRVDTDDEGTSTYVGLEAVHVKLLEEELAHARREIHYLVTGEEKPR